MSNFQTVSESELQSIHGGVGPLVVAGLLVMGFEVGFIAGVVLADKQVTGTLKGLSPRPPK